jgi:hypothetical protein
VGGTRSQGAKSLSIYGVRANSLSVGAVLKKVGCSADNSTFKTGLRKDAHDFPRYYWRYPKHIMNTTTASLSRIQIFFIVILPWATSTLMAYIMAMSSISTTMANILLLTSVLCLIWALILISRQKIFTALFVSMAPAPAIIGFAVAASYIANVLNSAV